MPTTTDIKLPKSHTPIFPDRCVACGQNAPDARYRAATNSIGWWTTLLGVFGKQYAIEVPACRDCCRRMRQRHWLQLIVLAGFIVIGGSVATTILKTYDGPMRRWLGIGIVLVCLLPFILWDIIFPKHFDMTAFSDTVDYEFRDPVYAEEFAELNQHVPK